MASSSGLLLSVALFATYANACTTVTVNASDGTTVIGRTMELGIPLTEKETNTLWSLVTTARGAQLQAQLATLEETLAGVEADLAEKRAELAATEARAARMGAQVAEVKRQLVDPHTLVGRKILVPSGMVGEFFGEDAAYECWLAFGGSPRPATKKKEDKGFFGNFVAQIAENAGGVKDTREKDQWGNPISGMTAIDQAVITSEQKAVLASMSK